MGGWMPCLTRLGAVPPPTHPCGCAPAHPQLTRQLRVDGWPALCIHGDKTQQVCGCTLNHPPPYPRLPKYPRLPTPTRLPTHPQERDWVLSEFKSGKSPIMLATDVAARGLGASSDTRGYARIYTRGYMRISVRLHH